MPGSVPDHLTPMKFGDLTLAGFRSFRKPQTLHFAGGGLTYVTGENEAEPRLGANGIGKSSLFEGLHWILFGRTSRSLRASEISNWTGDASCRGELELDGHHLVRTWKPNSLTLDGAPIDQGRVLELLGLGEEAFLYSIHHAQFVEHFADRGPSAQLEIFSEVLRLQLWEDAADKASEAAKKLKAEAFLLRVKIADLRGSWKELAPQLHELEYAEANWWRTRLITLRSLWSRLRARRLERKEVDEQLTTGEKLAEELARGPLAEEIEELRKDIDDRRSKMRAHERDLERLKPSALKGKCPTCFQKVDVRLLRSTLEEQRESIRALVDELMDGLGPRERRLKEMEAELVKALKKYDVTWYRALHSKAAALKVHVADLERDIQTQVEAVCPFDSAKMRARYEAVDEELRQVNRQEQQIHWRISAYEFWVKAFREIRLSLVNEALVQFEAATNDALALLGLGEWSIEYDVQSETKGGKVNKGFVIYVHSPYNQQPVPFMAWSGGESQRLRLAIAFGLSDLIQDFCGVHSNVEIFDEPTNWLSGLGLDDLLQVLAQRAKDRKCEILLADHKALGESNFGRIVTLAKGINGSRIMEQ